MSTTAYVGRHRVIVDGRHHADRPTVRRMVVTVAAIVAAIVATLTLTTGAPTTVAAPVAPVATVQAVTEDDPAWDCRVDGNRMCGPITTPGPDGTVRMTCPPYTVWSDDDAPVCVSVLLDA